MGWSIVGHERPVALLERALVSDQLSHAYVLSGPEGIGKRTLALELARAALCLGGGQGTAPCGACSSCSRVSTDNHPDLRIVELDTEHVQISRKEIGQIQADASLRPLLGERKVYVLVEVERLSAVAGNQLLKLLEEPPPAVTFVLTSADIGAVLPTIISRCQVVRMQPVQRETIQNHLTTRLEVEPEVAEIIAGVADGRVGWAIRAGADTSLLEARSQSIEELVALIESARLARLLKSQEIAGRWTGDRGRVIDELDWWARALRDAAVLAAAPSHDAASGAADIVRVAGRLSARESIDAARAVQETARLLEQNVNPRLALDTLVLDLPTVDARN